MSFTFDKNGNFISETRIDFTVENEPNDYSPVIEFKDINMDIDIKGEWEWADGKEEVEIMMSESYYNGESISDDELDLFGIDNNQEFEISRLTNKELWFEDETGVEFKCEKN